MAERPVRIGMMSFAHLHAGSYAHSIVTRPDTEMVGIADHDPAAAIFMHRAKQLALTPPGPDWEPINTLEGK